MEELRVDKVIISKQEERSNNFEKFEEIVNRKHIKVLIAEKERKINIEKELFIKFIWPDNSNLIQENILNNNSIVCKICYKTFSILFTGDIEEVSEKQILQEYNENLDSLKSTLLKIAHHGSKTSTTEEFLRAVLPKYALIGVGENNTFGHPSDEVIERLKKYGVKVYRTDTDGEISITVNRNGEIVNIQKFIK